MPTDLAAFNTADAARVRPLLTACLAVPRWVDTLLAGRPYPDLAALFAAADQVTPLMPGEIRDAMSAHPRIGEKPAKNGDAAEWSRSEQSGVDDAAAEAFAGANAEYKARFGHVYLVCANGRDGEELLTDLVHRLRNDPETELRKAGEELAKIGRLRLEKAVTS
ncbi:2-oxo-4-hydroxy-4-carboxy-5-ureidoimidazoline decarboxylase [Amycolatopsis sp. NPDC059027]|uniref:2-oxo-4-hydroxy-4-carboxy-5-ureidoimidazoline decarboxylase n=1 Tax=unclassified Amycolatopsis TaxID=2618356 RepID=UPI00366B35FC